MNLKKVIGSIALVATAIVTGYSVAEVYVDSTKLTTNKVSESEEELREDSATIESLVQQSETASSPADFSGMELYLIAEYKMNNSTSFMKEMIGKSVSIFDTTIYIRSQKIKMNDKYVFYKLSPSTGLAPNICNRVVYNTNKSNVYVSNTGYSSFKDVSSAENYDVVFPSSSETTAYTLDQYYEKYNTTPTTSVLPYVISSKTCPESSVSEVIDNGDGTYSFTISLSGDNMDKAAVYYTYEIMNTCGYSSPGLVWSSSKFVVTINSDFTFNNISYTEKYTIASDDIPVMKKADVTDYFTDYFYYDADEITSRAISDYTQNEGSF